MINIGIKKKFGDIEVSLETAVEDKDDAKEELKNLYELLRSSQKDLFPESEKSAIPSNKFSYMKGN